jgi:hypothetical protein
MPDVAQQCQNCVDMHEGDAKHEVRDLVTLANRTQNKKLEVDVCPWCDGGTIESAEANAG